MNSELLDDSQLGALEAEVLLVEAGPGAGKTRTIVERVRRHSDSSSRGIALISFTNTAADEARRRCHSSHLAVPNYVGTVDSFLHRFVVTPAISLSEGSAPKYITSWGDLPENAALVRVNGISGKGLRLGAFKVNLNGKVEFSGALSTDDKQYLAACRKENREQDLLENGLKRLKGYIESNTYDSELARLKAFWILSDDENPIARRIATRFSEIIIDEFQDCSEVEVEIVRQLKRLGVNVVVVADPDQAIYEFRDASPDFYRAYRESLPEGSIVQLEKNYRSSDAICKLVSVLRSVGTGNTISVTPGIESKIVVVSGSPQYQRTKFKEQVVANNIPDEQSIVLAHKKLQARAIAGFPTEDYKSATSTHKTYTLLRGVMMIQSATSPQERKVSLDRAQRVLLTLFSWAWREQGLSSKEQLEILGISRIHIASYLLGLSSDAADWSDARSVTTAIRQQTEAHFGNLSRELSRPSTALALLKDEHWQAWQDAQGEGKARTSQLNHSHIHAVKGREFSAVLLSVEKPYRGRGVWELVKNTGTDEALRVMYVGASRAKTLLVLGCKSEEAELLTEMLRTHQIEYDLFHENGSPASDRN